MIEGHKIEIINNKWDRCARKFDLKIGPKIIHPPLIAPMLVSQYDMKIFFDFITKNKENSTYINTFITRLTDANNTIKPIINLIKEMRKDGQKTLEGRYSYSYLQDFLNKIPIIIDPCSEYTFYNTYRKEI